MWVFKSLKLPYQGSRESRSGLSWFEVLVALSIASIFLIGATRFITQTLKQQQLALERLELSELGRGLLLEYELTYPLMPKAGRFAERWDWQISDTLHINEDSEGLKDRMEIRRLHLRISKIPKASFAQPAPTFQLEKLVLRKVEPD